MAKVLTPEEEAALRSPQAPVTEEKKSDLGFSFDKLIKFGQLEKTVTIVEGLTITLHTLTESERDSAFKMVRGKQLEENILVKGEVLKRPLMSYAISQINDIIIDSDEKRADLLERLEQSQTLVIDLIYFEYQKLITEQLGLVQEGLKKS